MFEGRNKESRFSHLGRAFIKVERSATPSVGFRQIFEAARCTAHQHLDIFAVFTSDYEPAKLISTLSTIHFP